MRNLLFIGPFLLLFSGCYLSEELPSDQQVFDYAQPESVGLNRDYLNLLNQSISSNDYENIEALMAVKDGKIIFENYWESRKRNNLIQLRRSTALFSNLAVGLLIKDGLIDSLATPVYHFLPSYQSFFEEEEDKKEITIEHLLSHRSGLIWDEINITYESPDNDLTAMKNASDWVAYLLEKPLEAPPGLRVTYNSGAAIILGRIIENITKTSVENYISERVFKPLDIENWVWEKGNGVESNLADGLYLSTLDLTKIGYLYLNGGFWRGREILPTNFIRSTNRSGIEISKNVNYASNWWFFSDDFVYVRNLEANDIFYFPNDIGTHLYVVPHQNMVVTIVGRNFFYGNFNPSLYLFFTFLNSSETLAE